MGMSSPARSERRASRRFALGTDVTVRREAKTLRLRSSNIGTGGIELRASDSSRPAELDTGDIVELEFNLPLLSAPVVVRGEVRWIEAGSCGIQFLKLSARVVSTINRLQWRSRTLPG